MTFALRRDESFAAGAQRTAGRQLEKAIEVLVSEDEANLRAAVHGVRKQTKRVRAVARLVRSGIGKRYAKVNVATRDAARVLSPVREASALLGTFDDLVAAVAHERHDGDLLPVRIGLARQATATIEVDVDRAVELLTRARRLVEQWAFDDGGAVIGAGLEATYRRGRRGFRAALDDPSPAAFHEWRKATKQLWHQTQLIEPAAPTILNRQARALHDLADSLGDAHDLAVLVEVLRADEDDFGGAEPVTTAMVVAGRRRVDLERRALTVGARLFVEKPTAFVARMLGYLEAWDEHGDEEPAGEIRVIAPPQDDLEHRTRDQLYRLAQEAGLPGRSSLSRDDLLGALRARGQDR